MKIIVIGAGKVGKEICRRLAEQRYDIVVVDTDDAAVGAIVNTADIKGIVGAGELAEVQREAGVPRADLVIAATEKDEVNILCCLIAKSLKARHTIARVRDPQLAGQSEFMRANLGIDFLVNPEYEAAVAISRGLRYPAADQVDYSDKARVDIVSVEIGEGNTLIGMKLSEVSRQVKLKVLICAVGRGGRVIIPNGDFVFEAGDTVFVTGKYLGIDSFFKRCGIAEDRIKTALIVGGGRISQYLAESLDDNGIAVKIIDPDKALCEELSESLGFATIICGDGTNKALLEEEGAKDADVFIALTGHDEINIMVSLYAKKLNVPKIITKINNAAFAEIADSLNLSNLVSPKAAACGQILRFVNSISRHDESMLAYYPLLNGAAQATAFLVDNERVTGNPIKKMTLKKDMLIASIVHGGSVMLPDGDTVLSMGDTVLVITTDDRIKRIEDILA